MINFSERFLNLFLMKNYLKIRKSIFSSNIFIYTILCFVFFTLPSYANEDNYYQATIESLPNVLIGGCVNAITGSLYINEPDVIALGKQSLVFNKRYISINHKDDRGSLEHKLSGWSFVRGLRASSRREKIGTDRQNRDIMVSKYSFYDSDGALYKFSETIDGRGIVLEDILRKGHIITSAQNNYLNATMQKEGIYLCVTFPDGTIRNYKGQGPYVLNHEVLKNGNTIGYDYGDNSQLTKIVLKTRRGHILSEINIINKCAKWVKNQTLNHKSQKYDFEVKTSNNKNVYYDFLNYQILTKSSGKREKGYLFYLSDVKLKNQHQQIRYHLDTKNTNPLLKEFELPDGRKIGAEYYFLGDKNPEVGIKLESDWLFEKVSALKAPLQENGDWIINYRLYYGYLNTKAFDYYNNKTEYLYSPELRIEEIKKYQGENNLKYFEKYIWGENNSNEQGFLKEKLICNANGNVLSAKKFEYDTKGNLLKETIVGNLTGENPNNETFVKNYKYNRDNLVISQKDQNGFEIQTSYIDNTNLLKSKFKKFEDKIKERYFYEYDEDLILTKEIVDDGETEDIHDLKGISKKIIKEIIPRHTQQFYGMPDAIIEKYLDLLTGEEKIFRKELFSYNAFGNVIKKDIYDEKGFIYSLNYEYDKDNLISETNPLGYKAYYFYDDNHNKVKEIDFSKKETHYQYDKCNRLIETKILGIDDLEYKVNYKYDYNHNKIKEIDPRGNFVDFKYDAFGNIIEKTLPEIIDENNIKTRKVFHFE